ncbi:MAG: peptide chain release factor aRF-1 [Candidatus Lokiarchaeota archaeon]|nr:peptide chain release factor aRF-1 [Candidatus Lokiarchaeota archaeon]
MSTDEPHKSNDLKVYRTKKLLEELKSKKGFHTELISLYIPHDRKLSDVTNYLKNEISESQNIKSKLTRKNVLDGISTLLGMLKNYRDVPENGIVMFAGAIPQNNTPGTERMEKYIVDPPEKIKTFRYHCASEFLLWPLEETLSNKETYGLISIGRKESAVGYIRGNHMEVVREFTSGLHGKHRQGGQSQRRFERLQEEGELYFYRKISAEVNQLFLEMEELHGIFIGGPGPSKEKFVSDDGLDYRLKDKIIDVVDLAYSGSEGLRALVDKVKDQMENIKYVREAKVMNQFMKELSTDKGLALYGYDDIKKALNFGAVDMLIASEKLDDHNLKITCSNCGYSEQKKVREQELIAMEAHIQEQICPKCSSNAFNISSKQSVIEELGEIAESMGTDVEIISSETELGETLYSTFGGIVAILRYKLNY